MTSGEVETYLYNNIKAMNPPISGGVYYRGMRPMQNLGNNQQDCVIAIITGTGNQIEKGSCVVNIYVPDIRVASGMWLRDKTVCDTMATWLDTIPDSLNKLGDIYFSRSAMTLTLEEESLKEHFVSLKMDFKVLQ